MAKERILEEKRFYIARQDIAKRIRIADPMYLMELKEGSKNKNLLKLTLDTPTHKTNRFVNCVIQKVEYTYTKKEDDFDSVSYGWVVRIHILKDREAYFELEELLKKGRIFETKETKHLCCDTAQFLLNNHNIHTLADGYYGCAYIFKNILGMTIELFWKEDAYASGGDIKTIDGIEAFIKNALKEEPTDDVL